MSTGSQTGNSGAPVPQQPGRPQSAPVGRGFFDWIRSLGIQRTQERWIGGVSGAIAGRLGWDPLIVRIIWLALAFLGGFGAMLYGIAWMLLPDERDGRILAQSAIEDGDLSSNFWGALLFIVIGCPGSAPISIPAIILIAAAIALVYHRSTKASGTAKAQATTGPAGPAPTPRPTPVAASTPSMPVPPVAATMPYAPGAPAGSMAAPATPFPVARKRPAAGPAVVGACAGIIAVALGLVLLAYVQSRSPWAYAINGVDLMRALAIWAVASAAFLGICLILTGMARRKGGGLTVLSVVMLIVALCATSMDYTANYSTISGISPQQAAVHVVGSDATYKPSDFDALARGIDVRASNVMIDLADWNLIRDTACPEGTLPLWATASNVTIRVPSSCKAVFSDAGHSSVIVFGDLSGADAMTDLEDDMDSMHSDSAASTDQPLLIPVIATASSVRVEKA